MRWIAWASLLLAMGCFSEPDVPGNSTTDGSSGSSSGPSSTSCQDGTCTSSTTTVGSETSTVGTTASPSTSVGSSTSPESTSSEDGSTTQLSGEVTVGEVTVSAESTPPEGSTTETDDCASEACADCVLCAFDTVCAAEHATCDADGDAGGCMGTLQCLGTCLQDHPDDLATCVADCDCNGGDLLTGLVECASAVCHAGGACPALPCSS